MGKFLDGLRQELVALCKAQSHVSVLPPREIVSVERAQSMLADRLAGFAPFTVEVGQVAVFESTSVVYLAVGKGRSELLRLHDELNRGPLAFDERFQYHPHITLAQDFPVSELAILRDLAERRWAEYKGPRKFQIDRLTFVQNTECNVWHDLRDFCLNGTALVGSRA
jgi:2'-5' RNA ligase